MNEYSHFNLITLTFFYTSNAFHVSIGVVYTVYTFLIPYLLGNTSASQNS